MSYYGVGLDKYVDEIPAITCPMVFHFAANDALGPPETREKIQAALAVNPLIEHYVYPDCDHAFATPGANTSTNPQP